jgi:hypothetical protein
VVKPIFAQDALFLRGHKNALPLTAPQARGTNRPKIEHGHLRGIAGG